MREILTHFNELIAFDWQNLFVSSIKFDYRTQSNTIERLGLIGFDYRTFD